MKYLKQYIRTLAILLLLLIAGSITNHAWATDVTYHILTLPIDNTIYNMKAELSGKRLEAVKVVVKGQTNLELPAHYKSPLVTSFTYYSVSDPNITKSGSAVQLFANSTKIKGFYYIIGGSATPVSEGSELTGQTAEYYVVYTYNEALNDGSIAKLDGTIKYNIRTKYRNNDKDSWKDKGFFALNRGRNNRPAVLPTAKVDPEMLASEDFMKLDYEADQKGNLYVKDTKVSAYWKDNNNKNKEEDVAGQFYFMFKFEGKDPYNIIIRTAYAKDTTYIEKNDNSNNEFVYKYHKEGSLFANGSANAYIASDEHKHYNYIYNSNISNPTSLTEGSGTGYDSRAGYYHGQTGTIWNSFAILNNSNSTGYVFMGTRTVDGDGVTPDAPYYLKETSSCNNLVITSGNSTNNLSIEGLYPIEKVTFKVVTPFGHTVSVTDQVSKYTVDNDPILTKYLPAALKRKYCNFNGNFYKDAECTQAITHFSQATKDPSEGYQVYVGYDVTLDAPKFLSPSASYTTATWYELTDEGSVQESGRKIKNNSSTYKNNGANGTYEKESEFAFEGDPYELKVLYRKGTEGGSKTYVTLSTYDTWDMPADEIVGSFLLRKYNDTGYWNWDAGQVSAAVSYGSDLTITPNTDKNAQTITITLSGLNTSKYYKITTSGAGASQIVSVTPSANNVQKVTGTTMTVVVKLAENKSGADKTMTVTFQEYNDAEGNTTFGSASDVTITQGTASSSFTGNVVGYHATNSTRVKVLELPTRTFTYNIVDKSGRIAVKASTTQAIFSALSLASIPSIIVSPFLVGETVTFYDDAYSDKAGRGTLLSEISETPDTDHDIFVTYTTAALNAKPYKLSEDQEIFVRLNGQYIYYEDGVIKTSATSKNEDKYKWKLRNRDPYDMLIDNMAARTALGVANQSEPVDVYNDDGSLVAPKPSRQKGAWVWLNEVALPATSDGTALAFTTDRTKAEHFIAKSSTALGVYEVMVATGSSIDASTTYYNIGRPSDNTVKIYNNTTYVHGNPLIAFRLEQSAEYTYHLIDKAKHELLTVNSKSPELVLPAEYQSPLVGTYNYYATDQITEDKSKTPYEYTPKDPAVKITNISGLNAVYTTTNSDESTYTGSGSTLTATDVTDMEDKAKVLTATGDYYYKIGSSESYTYKKVTVTRAYQGTDIYVTYVANDVVNFNKGQYMLKFLEPYAAGYNLEDGLDKLTSTKIQAIYPYCNGDGNLNIYGDDMQKEQFNGGASTRPRWAWYFDSESKDPYHVTIRSKSTIKYNNVNYNTYLTTYAVHFNQDAEGVKKVVTGGTLPGIAAGEPTEYMVLGTLRNYQLLTTKEINDGTTIERRKVTSLEQYWKTYNMIKLDVLGISNTTDAYSDDETTWVVPKTDDPETGGVDESNYRTTLAAKDWHSYTAYANATRWNGYNDKTDGHEKKVVENLEHWYQTFDMGNGTFDIENAEIPPVLVLLDLHGWEIMRLPLPTVNYPEGDDELKALRAYDSPMVDKYYFYSNATKASGCHKYSLRLDDKGKERDQIKRNGEHYSSTSLGDLPPITASGVKSGSAFNDQFVIYTVKEEYAKSYDYAFTPTGSDTYTETVNSSKFLVLLRSRFLRYVEGASNPSYFSKPIYEASNPVGGNVYDAILDPQQSTVPQKSTSVDDSPKDGFIDDINLWYLQPNQNIDKEMGIKYASTTGSTGEPWTEFEYKKYYYDNGKAGFDPYNIQLKNAHNGRFVTSHLTSTALDDGIMIGNYSGEGGTTDMTLEEGFSYAGVDPMAPTGSVGYDHTNIKMSNQTFMAVSDANGNLQLMPRFDHKKRVNLVNNSGDSYTTLQDSENHAKASADDNASMGTQTVFLVRPQIFEYKIINNSGSESIRYKRSGDYYPAITDHFKSPLAKDFTYYAGLTEHGEVTTCTAQDWTDAELKRSVTTEALMNSQINLLPTSGTYYYQIGTRGVFTYKKVTVTKGLQEKQITGSFAEAKLNGDDCTVIVRYDYDADADHDGDKILEGKWFTAKLANKDLQSSETRVTTTEGKTQGTGVNLYADDAESPTKPGTINASAQKWQWKFLQAPTDPSSDYYEEPDPYDVRIFNRYANYTTNPSEQPSPMAVGIKVPNANNGADHFALLSHSEGGYALAVAGTGNYTYNFVNGADMTTSVAATTATEASFTQKSGIFDGVNSQLLVNDEVEYNFNYKVINNGGFDYVVDKPGYLAVEAPQDNEAAESHGFFPYLPEAAQTPLLRMKDYKYYGFAKRNTNDTPSDPNDDTYEVIPQTVLYTLYGLYDDVVYVRYNAYNMDSTEFKVPNRRKDTSPVERHSESHDASMNINGGLPYNIIWKSDNMMQSTDNTNISDGGKQSLSGNQQYVWYFTNNDPYALKIKHKGGKYVDGDATLEDEADAKQFMLLKKSGYDYGILQETGGNKKLSEYGQTTTSGDSPTEFIIFGLSVHDLIYRLIIAKTCTKAEETDPNLDHSKYVVIPYREGNESTYQTSDTWTSGDVKKIFGSTQRNLTAGSPAGATYQLGETITWGGENHTYSHDAGKVSIGDVLKVPNVFNRPNCTYEYYIQDIYDTDKSTVETALNNKYKGLKLKNLMSDAELIDKTVIVNVVYSFDNDVATNTGMDFVRSIEDKCWYTYETQGGGTPYLAHYTNAWGLQAMEGRTSRYSNDYLWTPLGDVYGFKMYNRYMIKNSNGSDKVMTFAGTVAEDKNLAVAKPGTAAIAPSTGTYTEGNEIFELLPGDNPNSGYFRVHPVVNTKEQTQYYVKRGGSNYAVLSTTPSDWAFGLDMSLMEPYYERAGYVGGLTPEGKTAYENAVSSGTIMDIQHVVFDDQNIINFTSGYYRLHNQPGVSSINPVRYASGYLHDIEKTAVSGGIPMHFYSKEGITASFAGAEDGLGSGFTVTDATRGEIPIAPTEYDASTIFYINGSVTSNQTISEATMSTQGLNVLGNKMTTETGTTFTFIDIGGATLLIANELEPTTRKYFNFDQTSNIYDLKFAHECPTDDAKWCLQPVQKTSTVGNGEMPLQIATNQGGDGHYYATFYAPFDVLLPNDVPADNEKGTPAKNYYAYFCKIWDNAGLHPTPVPAVNTYPEGKFVPAGTPVIIRTTDESNIVTLTLPSTSPTVSSVTTDLKGSYLEQLLTADAAHDVYTLGLPMTSTIDSYNKTTGEVVAPLPEFDTNGVGFYINATYNKESDPLQSLWSRNNRYVLHNKIYYRAANPSLAPQLKGPEFVPVIFDDLEEQDEELNPNGAREIVGDGCVYDLMGRKVATREQVEDGSWKQRVATGIYILNGKKFQKK